MLWCHQHQFSFPPLSVNYGVQDVSYVTTKGLSVYGWSALIDTIPDEDEEEGQDEVRGRQRWEQCWRWRRHWKRHKYVLYCVQSMSIIESTETGSRSATWCTVHGGSIVFYTGNEPENKIFVKKEGCCTTLVEVRESFLMRMYTTIYTRYRCIRKYSLSSSWMESKISSLVCKL